MGRSILGEREMVGNAVAAYEDSPVGDLDKQTATIGVAALSAITPCDHPNVRTDDFKGAIFRTCANCFAPENSRVWLVRLAAKAAAAANFPPLTGRTVRQRLGLDE